MSALSKMSRMVMEGKERPTEKDLLEAAEALVERDPTYVHVLLLALVRENIKLRVDMEKIEHAHVSQKELREMRQLIWECSTYHSKC